MQDVTPHTGKNQPGQGRPTAFTPELGEFICDLISEGKSLNSICATLEEVPHIRTVLRWVLDGEVNKTPELANFTTSYTRAMEIRAEVLAGEVIDIADYKGSDFKTDANGVLIFDDAGNPIIDHDNIQRAKLQIETRLKYIAFLKPKKYGNKNTTEIVGDPNRPIELKTITIEFVEPKGIE